MKGGTRLAVGIAVGYLMGRTKKMRLALMITAAGATGGVAKSPGDLARRVVTGLGATGPVEELMDSVRGELKTAAASAATTMATRRIDALADRISAVPGGNAVGEATGGGGDEEAGTDEDRANGGEAKRRAPRRGEAKDTGRGDTGADEEEEDENQDENEAQAASDSEGEPESDDESESESQDESEDESESYRPVTRRRRSDSGDGRAAAKEYRGESGSRGEGARATRRPARAASGSGQAAERRTRR